MNVGDLERHAGVSVRSIHHYESVGLLAPDRGGNGYRIALQLDALTTVRREIEARLDALGAAVPEQES